MTRFTTLLMSGAMAALPMTAFAQDTGSPSIGQIEVTADFSSVDGANAAEYYPDLADDLEQALGQSLQPFMTGASDGQRVIVLVSEVSVDGNPVLTGQNANRLSGTMFIETAQTATRPDSSGGEVPDTESITVVATSDPASSATVVAGGPVYVVQPTSDNYYDALVAGFAAVAAERIEAIVPDPS